MNDTPPDASPPDGPPPDAPSADEPAHDEPIPDGRSSDEPSIWDVPDHWHAPADWDASSTEHDAPPAAAPSDDRTTVAPAAGPARRSPTVPDPAGRPPDGGPPAAPGQTPDAGRRRLLIVIAVAAVLVVAAAAATALALTRGGPSGADPTSSGAAQSGGSPTVSPRPTADASADSPEPTRSPSPSQSAAATGPSDAAVPILMYHLIAAAPANSDYPGLYVRPATFARQMEYLHDEGYQAVSLARVFDAWEGKATLPQKPVVISFDDGYPSHYLTAAPIMELYGWKGLLNADWKVLDESPRLLAQVRLLAEAGWEMGSHSLSHPDLTTLDGAQLEEEVAGSRRVLRKQLGVPIDFFCYPTGRYDDEVVAAVEAAGYRGATTTDRGLATMEEPYRLKRIRVDESMSPGGLAAALAAAPD